MFLKTNVELQTISNSSRAELPVDAMKKMVKIEAAQEQRVLNREHEKQLQETQAKELLVTDIGNVVYGMMAALIGEKWADSEYRKGFSVVEAVRLAVKFADYNNDGLVSRAESALLSMPPALFSALSPEGADGKQLSLDDILTALEDVSACDDVLVVDRPGEISLKTLYMPRGKCSLLIMPGWNLPASYAVSEGPTCPDKGSALAGNPLSHECSACPDANQDCKCSFEKASTRDADGNYLCGGYPGCWKVSSYAPAVSKL